MKICSGSPFFSFIMVTICAISSFAAPPLNHPKYSQMKQEFLNIDESYFSEIKFEDQSSLPIGIFETGANSLENKINEGGFKGWATFGGSYWCPNSDGKLVLCRYSTGGSIANNSPICGESVNNDYQDAVNNPNKICNPGTWADWSGTRLWTGAGDNKTYIITKFPSLENGPANRYCFEVELPVDRLRYSNQYISADPEVGHVVNPEVSHDNIDTLTFEFGTYTSPYKGESSTIDEEEGGTFQGGGTHFYHQKTYLGRFYPHDQAYALNENTLVACMGTAPSGVRSGMRPPYYANPLMSVVGENEEGLTDAYSYIPYVARIYFDLNGEGEAEALYPLTIKYNKIWAMYEHNDIFAMSKKGSVLGVDMILEGETTEHPFTIFNNAPEERQYRVTIMAGGNLPQTSSAFHFKVYIDENGNKLKDANETQEIIPNQLLTLPAQTDLHLVIHHTPGFNAPSQTYDRYGRTFAHGSITIQEIGRLRMASYMVRTWRGSALDIQNKENILAGMVYPAPDSQYAVYAEWNQDKPNNNRLIRNTPDFQMAQQRAANLPADTTPPTVPGNLAITESSFDTISLNWAPSTDDRGLYGYKIEFDTNNSFSSFQSFMVGRVTGHILVGLYPSTNYYIRVRAMDSAYNESGPSNIVTVKTTGAPDVPPNSPQDPGNGGGGITNVIRTGSQESVKIPCRSTVKFFNQIGDLIKSVACSNRMAVWDGRAENGSQVSGTYIVYEEGEPHRKVVVLK